MTRMEQRDRRRRMADMVKAGESVSEVAAKFNVSSEAVRIACRERGMSFKREWAKATAK